MSNWYFAASALILLVGTGVMVLSAWLGWSIWQRNGRRGKVGLLELLRFAAVTLLAFTFLQPEYVRLIERTEHRRLPYSMISPAACSPAMS